MKTQAKEQLLHILRTLINFNSSLKQFWVIYFI